LQCMEQSVFHINSRKVGLLTSNLVEQTHSGIGSLLRLGRGRNPQSFVDFGENSLAQIIGRRLRITIERIDKDNPSNQEG